MKNLIYLVSIMACQFICANVSFSSDEIIAQTNELLLTLFGKKNCLAHADTRKSIWKMLPDYLSPKQTKLCLRTPGSFHHTCNCASVVVCKYTLFPVHKLILQGAKILKIRYHLKSLIICPLHFFNLFFLLLSVPTTLFALFL